MLHALLDCATLLEATHMTTVKPPVMIVLETACLQDACANTPDQAACTGRRDFAADGSKTQKQKKPKN